MPKTKASTFTRQQMEVIATVLAAQKPQRKEYDSVMAFATGFASWSTMVLAFNAALEQSNTSYCEATFLKACNYPIE